MVTNQNRLTPIFRFFLFDKFKGNTLLHNVLKKSRSYHVAIPLILPIINGTKPVINLNSATTKKNDTNIKRPL